MPIKLLTCPNCGAPLNPLPGQTLVACVYCNSSVRILTRPDAAPSARQDDSISHEVIDEVKRMLVLGQKAGAVGLYQRKANVSQAEADQVVTAIQKACGYRPPLNNLGLAILAGMALICLLGLAGGVILLARNFLVPGIIMLALAGLFAYMSWNTFLSDVKATLVLRQGRPALAAVLKTWEVMPVFRGGDHVGDLIRFLLEVHPEQGAAYQAEANCIVRAISRPKFEVGQSIRVKVDRRDPSRLVIASPASGEIKTGQ